MGFEAVSITIFFIAVLGIIIIVLRHLPDAVEENRVDGIGSSDNLEKKGVVMNHPSGLATLFGFWRQRIWHFFLEAKDVRPGQRTGYKLKKMLKRTPNTDPQPIILPASELGVMEIRNDESYFLDKIKHEPKNLEHYRGLGLYYLDNKSYLEAKDVFLYLSKMSPGDSALYGRLGFVHFHLKEFSQSVEAYEKSVALDSTQPNRYFNLALAYEALGNHDKALESIRKCVNIEPGNQKYKDALARFELRK